LGDSLEININNVEEIMLDVKRVEIVINSAFVDATLDLLDQAQVSGYTVIKETSGKGDRGPSCDDLYCNYHGSFIMTVCTNERQLNCLVEKLKPLLKKAGGVCLIDDAKWIQH
jgi:nitrogen regulatory protein PII